MLFVDAVGLLWHVFTIPFENLPLWRQIEAVACKAVYDLFIKLIDPDPTTSGGSIVATPAAWMWFVDLSNLFIWQVSIVSILKSIYLIVYIIQSQIIGKHMSCHTWLTYYMILYVMYHHPCIKLWHTAIILAVLMCLFVWWFGWYQWTSASIDTSILCKGKTYKCPFKLLMHVFQWGFESSDGNLGQKIGDSNQVTQSCFTLDVIHRRCEDVVNAFHRNDHPRRWIIILLWS